MICAPELHNGDIVVYDVPHVHEIEIKISKSDLWHGEAKKDKHSWYAKGVNSYYVESIPNKFSICVPIKMKETAEEWVIKTNRKYGLIIITEDVYNPVWITKSAKLIHPRINQRFNYTMLRKLSSMAVESYRKEHKFNPTPITG